MPPIWATFLCLPRSNCAQARITSIAITFRLQPRRFGIKAVCPLSRLIPPWQPDSFRLADSPGNDHAVSGTEFPSAPQHAIEPIRSFPRLSNKFVAENFNREILATLLRVHAGCAGLSDSPQESAANPNQVILKYLGAAGWEITDGTTTILIDPYLSRINGPAPPGAGSGHPIAGDTRRAYKWTDTATPDTPAIDAHIQRADFVLVTHTHYDHVLDVPHIALKTRATVIGTESTENVMRPYAVPEEQLITVREERTTSLKGFRLEGHSEHTQPARPQALLQLGECHMETPP
jgi:hypothetical protein